jgi:hypothetical protein
MRTIVIFSLLFSFAFLLESHSIAQKKEQATFHAMLFSHSPAMKGDIQSDEWNRAFVFSGFAWDGKLDRRQVQARVGATRDTLYISVISQLPAVGKLTTDIKRDSPKLVFDDSVEVWIDPHPGDERGNTVQLIINSAGRQAWILHPRGGEPENPAWRGHAQIINKVEAGQWICEIAIPAEVIDPGRKTDQGEWGLNICRNWKQPWAFSSLNGHAYPPEYNFAFTAQPVPIIHQEFSGDPTSGSAEAILTIKNPSTSSMTLDAASVFTVNSRPSVDNSKTLTLSPGETKSINNKITAVAGDSCSLFYSIKSSNGASIYHRFLEWNAAAPWKWIIAALTAPPVDLQIAYYPYRNLMRLAVDINGISEKNRPSSLLAIVRKAGGGNVKSIRLSHFVQGKEAISFSLPNLNGKYEVAVSVPGQGTVVKPFVREHFPWENNRLGMSDKVYPPFTPLQVKGNQVLSVLRKHTMNDEGLWDQVDSKGKSLLAFPMRYDAVIDGKPISSHTGTLHFIQVQGNQVIAQAAFQLGALSGVSKCTWDFDGTMRVDMILHPMHGHILNSLDLVLPFRNDSAKMLHAMGDGIRNTITEKIPDKIGVVWTSQEVQTSDLPAGFCSYILLGTPLRGICWFAENDHGWSRNPEIPCVDIYKTKSAAELRVHLVSKPTSLLQSRAITYGLLAAPVKPRLSPWRYQWIRGNYSLLGTDINWLALGDCGSVYPAGKDMYLWNMIRRGNIEHLSDAEIEQTFKRGEKYFAPYGQDMLNTFRAHVQYNLRSRYGTKMVFYYNRASYQAADEFQTFQDEWDMSDYRTIGDGISRSEIPIVPSRSYIDMALYWYGKSFDLAGNKGVYWDNWFFNPSYNTTETGAYKESDGQIIPSSGIWGLRALAKRTFQYMNERGMTPITMAHMTSTSILPMLSFATLQYDWEWKYSEEDFEDRFSREYVQMVSDGELAGTWPVVLGDQGTLANDPWTQRTFAAVCLLHEIMPGGRMESVWDPLLKPIFQMLDMNGYKVWRYWDDTPSPVQTGDVNLPVIVYAAPGKEAICVIVNYGDDSPARLAVDTSALGFSGRLIAEDVEGRKPLQVNGNIVELTQPLKRHDLIEIRLLPAGGAQ